MPLWAVTVARARIAICLLALIALPSCSYLEYVLTGRGPIETHTATLLKEARQVVDHSIVDRERARDILRLYEDMIQIFLTYDDKLGQQFKRLMTLNADYDAKREDIEQVLDNIATLRVELNEQVLKIRRRMVVRTSAKEWAQLAESDRNIFFLAKRTPNWDLYYIE